MCPSLITLRPVIPADLPTFFDQQRDPVASQMAAFPFREREAFMAHWTKIMQDESVMLRTVLEDGNVVGNVVSFLMDENREVGYWFGREYWGRGLATRALSAFLMEETRRPLHAWVSIRNPGSRRVLEKCGFTLEGEVEEGFVFVIND